MIRAPAKDSKHAPMVSVSKPRSLSALDAHEDHVVPPDCAGPCIPHGSSKIPSLQALRHIDKSSSNTPARPPSRDPQFE